MSVAASVSAGDGGAAGVVVDGLPVGRPSLAQASLIDYARKRENSGRCVPGKVA